MRGMMVPSLLSLGVLWGAAVPSSSAQGIPGGLRLSDSVAIERAALQAMQLDRMREKTRLVFDESGQQRHRSDSVNAVLRGEFRLLAATDRERGSCSPVSLDCRGLPEGTTVLDIGRLRVEDAQVVVVIRAMTTGKRLDGTPGTFGSATTLRLAKIEGEWRVIGRSMTAT